MPYTVFQSYMKIQSTAHWCLKVNTKNVLKFERQIQCRPWALGDILRDVHLQAETDKCSDGDGSIYVFFWLWPFLRTCIGVGWWIWIFLFLFKKSWLNLERKRMRLCNSDFLSFLRNCWSMWLGVIIKISDGLWT